MSRRELVALEVALLPPRMLESTITVAVLVIINTAFNINPYTNDINLSIESGSKFYMKVIKSLPKTK